MGNTIEDVTGGNLGAEARMGIVYTEGVTKRGMSLRQFVDVTSTNAANIFGLYPRKGVIAVGSDADLTLMDTRQQRRLSMADFHVADYSPWEGWEISGWPTTTILRGRVISHNGQLLASWATVTSCRADRSRRPPATNQLALSNGAGIGGPRYNVMSP